jgi:hypothetical protein
MHRIALLFSLLLSAPLAGAQPDDAMMAAYMAAAQPDEHHARLAEQVGDWTFSMTHWPAPGAPPQTAEGRMTSEMILGGRYLVATYHADMGGFPFEGRSMTAYDRTAGQYVGTWIDIMSTTVMISRGNDEDGALVMRSNFMDPVTRAAQVHRTVDRRMPDGTFVIEYFIEEGGTERQTMEFVYRRVATE